MPSTERIQLTFTLKMITAHVIETSCTVNNRPIHNFDQPDNHVPPSYEITPGFKPSTERKREKKEKKLVGENYSFKAVPLITFNLLRGSHQYHGI